MRNVDIPDVTPRHAVSTQLIIAVHNRQRPLLRALDSVVPQFEQLGQGHSVIVVCHGLGGAELGEAFARYGSHPQVHWVEHHDGIRSPAGPFNTGFASATADYVMVMGSDDVLAPGTWQSAVEYLGAASPDVLVVPLRHCGQGPLPNPLSRWGRTRSLEVVKDRLFYRTSPLALMSRQRLEQLSLRFTEGLPAGVDLEFSTRLWTSGLEVEFHPQDPGYVIMADATDRVTLSAPSLNARLAPVQRLLDLDWVGELPAVQRRALVIKLLRIHLLGALRDQDSAAISESDGAAVAELLRSADRLSPLTGRRGVLNPFRKTDARMLLDLANTVAEKEPAPVSTGDVVRQALLRWERARQRGNRWDVLFTQIPCGWALRESDLRRLLRYRFWPRRSMPIPEESRQGGLDG